MSAAAPGVTGSALRGTLRIKMSGRRRTLRDYTSARGRLQGKRADLDPGCGYKTTMASTRCLEGGSERTVGKIVCVGRNYAAHAAEMEAERPDEPLSFLKPSTALLGTGGVVTLPPWSEEVHHEVELVLRIGTRLSAAALEEAAAGIDAWGVGLDLTARDVQKRAKAAGHPWTVAKGWDSSAPVSELIGVEGVDLSALSLRLTVAGEVRQEGVTSAMIWSPAELVSFASGRFTLEPGDLVFTGTPEGVGRVTPGDRLVATAGTARLEVVIEG